MAQKTPKNQRAMAGHDGLETSSTEPARTGRPARRLEDRAMAPRVMPRLQSMKNTALTGRL